jgi:hypothetical protein
LARAKFLEVTFTQTSNNYVNDRTRLQTFNTPELSRKKERNTAKMKLLTLNFLCCARKTCKTNPAAFPLHPKEAELEQVEAEINPLLIQNMLPRLNWEALKTISQEVFKLIQHPIHRWFFFLQHHRLTRFFSTHSSACLVFQMWSPRPKF